MIEMPPLQFAETNGIRMGYYEAGPITDKPPVILCHGWPEIAFSWRHQIKALSEAGIRVIAPDQRGYGATDRPEPVEAYDIEHLTDDLVGLLDHLEIHRAIFVGHDWGGFIVWQMPLRHLDRTAGVVGVNTPHMDRAPADPIELFRMRFGDQMYIVQFQTRVLVFIQWGFEYLTFSRGARLITGSAKSDPDRPIPPDRPGAPDRPTAPDRPATPDRPAA